MNEDYKTIVQVDVALGRASLRRAFYLAEHRNVSVMVLGAVIDRLLDRRLELMAIRDKAAS